MRGASSIVSASSGLLSMCLWMVDGLHEMCVLVEALAKRYFDEAKVQCGNHTRPEMVHRPVYSLAVHSCPWQTIDSVSSLGPTGTVLGATLHNLCVSRFSCF